MWLQQGRVVRARSGGWETTGLRAPTACICFFLASTPGAVVASTVPGLLIVGCCGVPMTLLAFWWLGRMDTLEPRGWVLAPPPVACLLSWAWLPCH